MQNPYSARARKKQLPDRAKAERTARHMVTAAFGQSETLHVFTVPDFGPPVYMTFNRDQRAEAEAWTRDALMAGIAFFRSETGAPRPPATEHLDDDFHA